MSNLSCIIVEDEPLAAKVLTDYISQVPFLELKGTFKDAILAADFLRTNNVDLMFLDIHLPKLKGMAFLKTLDTSAGCDHHNSLSSICCRGIQPKCYGLFVKAH